MRGLITTSDVLLHPLIIVAAFGLAWGPLPVSASREEHEHSSFLLEDSRDWQ